MAGAATAEDDVGGDAAHGATAEIAERYGRRGWYERIAMSELGQEMADRRDNYIRLVGNPRGWRNHVLKVWANIDDARTLAGRAKLLELRAALGCFARGGVAGAARQGTRKLCQPKCPRAS